MKFTAAAAAVAAAMLATPALAQPATGGISGYANLGYSLIDEDVTLHAIHARLGGRGRFVGVEAEGAFGVGGDDIGGVDVNLNHEFAAYLVGFVPLAADNADIFARVGYGTSEIEGRLGGISASASDESWNFGGGGQYFFNGGNHGVRAEYTRMEFDDGGGANVWSIGYVLRFGGGR